MVTGSISRSSTQPAPGEPTPDGPLAGLRVLEVGSLIAGPFAGRLLADMGAEVIKVELPGKPDPLRQWGTVRDRGRALWWPIQSRNKKLVTLDLKRGQELFLELVRRSDAVLENFRPRTLERWGIGYDAMREVNPDVVLARVSGFGQTGPYAARPGFAAVAEAMGGLRALNGYPGELPPRTGLSLGDSLGALFATVGVLAALHHRSAGGSGQVVDVALTEACMALLESVIPEYDRAGKIRQPSGTTLEGNAPSNLFPTSDGKLMVIAANQDDLFRRLCDAMGQPELVDDPRFSTHAARGAHQTEIDEIVAAWSSQRTAREIDELLAPAGVVCGPLYTVADLVADPHFRERGALAVHDDQELGPMLGPGVVPRFSETPGEIRWSGNWEPGAHNDEIYRGLLGLDDERLSELSAEGII